MPARDRAVRPGAGAKGTTQRVARGRPAPAGIIHRHSRNCSQHNQSANAGIIHRHRRNCSQHNQPANAGIIHRHSRNCSQHNQSANAGIIHRHRRYCSQHNPPTQQISQPGPPFHKPDAGLLKSDDTLTTQIIFVIAGKIVDLAGNHLNHPRRQRTDKLTVV